ncbi:MAG TPA: hypothetical protein RMH85_32430 [Polyangiaceae bacterium LLY-WYZ-15_(1-7)]|nr:hypothetical protein [Sandaracinus sp.]HJL04843.1 hypothetical protein [Polyangiaceae bacterium LLY-WYZ-15_(1-7)]MBJ72470.1 hypothetical protein [Sandaracinus sp.]HJL13236.1 hypothetical protein [Polyangiaceae bacterium LLY-WYZ-15_(1-7)]HJL21736.1 hypothetical protein [Polyangiaceae bacterium LLY-WYZ-15_(1-7)]
MRPALLAALLLTGCASSPADPMRFRDAGARDGAAPDGARPDGAPMDDGGPAHDAAPPSDPDAGAACPGEGPAYLHGDLWGYWFNYRVACAPQHRWLWVCEQRLGPDACGPERQRFEDCWNARGDFPPTSWGDDSTPTPHSANYGVCQPHHFPEKNDATRRPGNATPCDVRSYDYARLRTADPRFGVDWWTGSTSMRHLTLKVFEAGVDPLRDNGQSDGLLLASTHPGDGSAFMGGLANHGIGGGPGGCVPPVEGDDEDPFPSQSFGAFTWVPLPTDRPVTLAASWIGPVSGGEVPSGCLVAPYTFPASFAVHGEGGKPWFTSNPCWDIQEAVRFEPGRHYVWDHRGLRMLPGCAGPPESVLAAIPVGRRAAHAEGSCPGGPR